MPPQPPRPWKGVRPAVAFGDSAPQRFYDRRPESYSMFVAHWNYDGMSADSLRLNAWPPGPAARNPRAGPAAPPLGRRAVHVAEGRIPRTGRGSGAKAVRRIPEEEQG